LFFYQNKRPFIMLTVFELVNPFTPALSLDAPLEKAALLFQKCALSILPVVREGMFCGILERKTLEDHRPSSPGSMVCDLLCRDMVFLSPRDSAWDAADLLAVGAVDMIPIVTEAGCLAGIVTSSDLPPSMRRNLAAMN
jgi:CBS domain-containing protein